jgi:hypothetical protein
MTDEQDQPEPRWGHRQSRANQPGYGKGRRPVNKGKKVVPQSLTRAELDRLMASFGRGKLGARNRAMIALMARLGLKVSQVVRMQPDHYQAGASALIAPGVHGAPNSPTAVDPLTRQILDDWLEFRRALDPGALAPFFCTVEKGTVGRELDPVYIRSMLRGQIKKCGIEKRVATEGLRKTFREHSLERSRRVGLDIVSYIDDEPFRVRYPNSHEKWRIAVDLHEAEPARFATAIGHHCRETLGAFADELAQLHGVESTRDGRTTDQLRAVIRSRRRISPTVRAVLDALVTLWIATTKLAHRQEHGAAKEGESLVAEDSSRMVFQTMLVMYEIDRALSRA